MLAAKDSRLWVFFDPNQDLYGGSRLKGLDLTEYTLKNNVRNTKQIAEAAYGCIGIAPQFANDSPPEGVAVQWLEVTGEQDQQLRSKMIGEVRSKLHQLINEEKLEPKNIVVTLGNFKLVENGGPLEKHHVRFDSIPRFKGLEADAVILCDVPSDRLERDDIQLYVGASRAKHVLTVIQHA
jgi:hypothetical protein